MSSHIFGIPVILPQKALVLSLTIPLIIPCHFLHFSSWNQNKDLKCTEYKVLGNAHDFVGLQIHTVHQVLDSIHIVACVSWPPVIKILERQLFNNFIYILSDFIFEIENSIWIKIYSYKVRKSEMQEHYP